MNTKNFLIGLLSILFFACQEQSSEISISLNAENIDPETDYTIIVGDFRSEPLAEFKLEEEGRSYALTHETQEPVNVMIIARGETFARASVMMEPGQDLVVNLTETEEGEMDMSYEGTASSVAQLMADMNQIENDFFEAQSEKEMRQYSLTWDEYKLAFADQRDAKSKLLAETSDLSEDMRYILEAEIWASSVSPLHYYEMFKNRELKEGEEKIEYPEISQEKSKIYSYDKRALLSSGFNSLLGTVFNSMGQEDMETITYGTLYLAAESEKNMYEAVINDPSIPDFFKEKGLSTVIVGNASYPSSPLSSALELKDRFLEDFPDSKNAAEIEEGYAKWERLKKGVAAPDFTLENPEGEMVSLSDFKGKIVYIDVWATWCGPCIKEFSYAKDIKEKFKDADDVVFMYVSVDKLEQKEKWKEDLVKHGLADGVNLFANGPESEFTDKYNRTGIPRYILIHKDGSIHDAKTFRPSSTEVLINEIQKLRGVSLDRALSMN